MTSENLERIRVEYQAGKAAFESGAYRQSVQHLERASALVERQTRLGGEVQIWLVTAYEAAGQRNEAIALCRQLGRHPDWNTRKQGRRLLYILEAPRLARRSDWLTQIPDLSRLSDNEKTSFQLPASTQNTLAKPKKPQFTPEVTDPSQVKTQDNLFVWIALGVAILILGGLIWFG